MTHRLAPIHLNGLAALLAAEREHLCKKKGEKDTEFVKRIACAYMNAHAEIEAQDRAERVRRFNPANHGEPKFYGAQCPSYPNCTGGCGLGCTHEIEAARVAADGEEQGR